MQSRYNKVGIVTLGCSKNTVDSERLAKQITLNNFSLMEDPEKADIIIINTCGFIETAKEESIDTILNAVELKKAGKLKKVVVAGCLSERYMDDLRKDIPEVDQYFGVEKYNEIIESLGGHLKDELLGERTLSTPSHFAYLKISEGCDNPCSFCAIPIMRGGLLSYPIERLVAEAESLAAQGTKELVVIGQDTTDYGRDLYGKRNLAELLDKLSNVSGIDWIRLMYAYPSHLPEDVIDIIANNSIICSYLDIPLQHISDPVLKSMRRGITKRRTIELLEKLRLKVPDITIRTTMLVGHPSEGEKEFQELYDFVKDFRFDRLGTFPYSLEEDTTGYELGDPLSFEEKEERVAELMSLQQEISESKNAELVGSEMKVLIDSIEQDQYVCRSHRDAPEVDGEVLVGKNEASDYQIGDFINVTITEFTEYDLFAKIKSV